VYGQFTNLSSDLFHVKRVHTRWHRCFATPAQVLSSVYPIMRHIVRYDGL